MNSLSFLEENKQCNCITDGLREGGGFSPVLGARGLGRFMVHILLDTATGFQVRHRKTGGGRERAAAAGSISLWPEPPKVSVSTAICCKLCCVGFISGSAFVLWLLLW